MPRVFHNRILLLIFAVAIIGSVFVLGYRMGTDRSRVDNLPGDVIGSNPKHIPESMLPVCDFTGARFVSEPCYSPPGSQYL